ncbi:MAG: exosortase Q [Rhizobacter sp.]
MTRIVLSTSESGRWLGRIDRLPPPVWLGLQAAALWTHWRWAAARVADGSDDPLGLAALAAFALLVAREVPRMSARPSGRWWAAAALATAAATLATFWLPPLIGAVFAALAMACGARAFLPSGHPSLPMAGLAVLALPVVSSLQFYAGFPLRVVTAQLSTWILQLAGLTAERAGTAMVVEGRLVIVDAPCSGVQMVWMAYFCACGMAAYANLADRAFLRRLPAAGLFVLAGNVVRNSVLVAMEATGRPVSEALHQGIGLVVLAAVCAGVVWVIRGGRDGTQ